MFQIERTTSFWALSRVVNMVLIVRLINLAPSIKVMHAILSNIIDIVRSLRPIFGILASLYYVYALLGMQLFANKIRIDSFDYINRTYLAVYCGSYKQLNYWSNNFNDFFSSLVVLWDLMVVNNWQIIINAYVEVTTSWHRIYFYFWWVICTIITLNVCVSLILDLFIMKWEKALSSEADSSRRTPLIKSIHSLFNDAKWKADDSKLKKELLKHDYIDFNKLIQDFNATEEVLG
jgi:two pore calcium channel protein 2